MGKNHRIKDDSLRPLKGRNKNGYQEDRTLIMSPFLGYIFVSLNTGLHPVLRDFTLYEGFLVFDLTWPNLTFENWNI
ncbi:MAG: hypothetical protein R6U03_00140 [Gillisia sp.]